MGAKRKENATKYGAKVQAIAMVKPEDRRSLMREADAAGESFSSHLRLILEKHLKNAERRANKEARK